MTDRQRLIVLIVVAVIVVIDICAATAVRIFANHAPTVAGDVAKVGIGVLGGAVMMHKRS